MAGPLVGMRVVDLTQVLAGPYCTMLLADLGAEVIKVEPPKGDVARGWGPTPAGSDPASHYGGYFASVNRNKRSVCIDIRTASGREQLHRVLADADVLVENFKAGTMDRLGLSYEALHDRYPRLVYASIRGFGDPRTGASPYADLPAFDIVAQAMGGIMSVTGTDADHPMKVGPGIGDIFPAALAAVGILAAIRRVDATGSGQLVDVAMYDAILSLNERIVYQHSISGRSPVPQGNSHPLLCPYGIVSTHAGHVVIAAPTDRHWRELTATMGCTSLGSDPRYATNEARLSRSAEVYALLERWAGGYSTPEVLQMLRGRVPCAPIHTAADIADDPHVAARSMIVEVDHPGGSTISIAGAPIKFSEDIAGPFVRAPLLGEHTEEVLGGPAILGPPNVLQGSGASDMSDAQALSAPSGSRGARPRVSAVPANRGSRWSTTDGEAGGDGQAGTGAIGQKPVDTTLS
jgi:crotonobetainyl-CoA:carnitine CoA-transferase CaiB-like acyl-CoA transferase